MLNDNCIFKSFFIKKLIILFSTIYIFYKFILDTFSHHVQTFYRSQAWIIHATKNDLETQMGDSDESSFYISNILKIAGRDICRKK